MIKGILEIALSLESHETARCLIERFIYILLEELGLEVKTIGSTTLKYPNLCRSPEPDCAFYIQNQALVADRPLNFAQDPPPELVVEIDITSTSIDKNALYASIGVPELWRYVGQQLRIYRLPDAYAEPGSNPTYEEVEISRIFSQIPKSELYRLLEMARSQEMQASRSLRTWLRRKLQEEKSTRPQG